jgi:excisionase family DNA binding protein
MTSRDTRTLTRDLAAARDTLGTSRLLTVRELAALLGLHEKTIYEWTARGQLPCIRLGNRLRFAPADITRWVASHKGGL